MSDRITGFRQRVVPADLAAPFTPFKRDDTRPNVGASLEIYLPEVFPIPSATEFNPVVSKSTVAPETSIDIGLTVQVPPNNVAVIRGVSFYITNMLTTTVVTWTLLVNAAPVPGYSNISIFPRATPYVGNSFDAMVRVPNGAKVTVNYTNTDGGTYVVGASVSGWWWPQELGKLWMLKGAL